mmetsp:Transcript_66721/g.195799  ORF Transcript_66721/g.195799 Transcript_66721/m.195799 type:complete len:99 (-) Transcript_66721:200-496(-)
MAMTKCATSAARGVIGALQRAAPTPARSFTSRLAARQLPEPWEPSHPKVMWRMNLQEGRRKKAVMIVAQQFSFTPWWSEAGLQAPAGLDAPAPRVQRL